MLFPNVLACSTGVGGGRWQESGGLLGLKYWFCRHGLEWCEQPEKIQQITKAKKKRKKLQWNRTQMWKYWSSNRNDNNIKFKKKKRDKEEMKKATTRFFFSRYIPSSSTVLFFITIFLETRPPFFLLPSHLSFHRVFSAHPSIRLTEERRRTAPKGPGPAVIMGVGKKKKKEKKSFSLTLNHF